MVYVTDIPSTVRIRLRGNTMCLLLNGSWSFYLKSFILISMYSVNIHMHQKCNIPFRQNNINISSKRYNKIKQCSSLDLQRVAFLAPGSVKTGMELSQIDFKEQSFEHTKPLFVCFATLVQMSAIGEFMLRTSFSHFVAIDITLFSKGWFGNVVDIDGRVDGCTELYLYYHNRCVGVLQRYNVLLIGKG